MPPDAFAHRSEVWGFLEDYAAAIRAPVRCGVEVTALRGDENNRYKLHTTHGTLQARSVVVATGIGSTLSETSQMAPSAPH